MNCRGALQVLYMARTFTLKIGEHIHQPDKKRLYNEQLFAEVAPRYDFVTKALSLGRDAAWKRQLVNALPSSMSAPRCIDLACGTGDVTRLLAERYPDGAITGIDLTKPMLELAQQRHLPSNVSLLHADMCDTGIEPGTIDVVTGSYALRNAPDLGKVLAEVRRIMKPDGIAAFLDFSKPASRRLQIAEYLLLKYWGSFWGRVLHRNPEVYAYIAESLALFPDRQGLRATIAGLGFEVVAERRFYFGILEMLVFKFARSTSRVDLA